MTLSRLTAWTLLAAAGFALLPRGAAQDKDPPMPKKGSAFGRLAELQGKQRIDRSELDAARDQFAAVAKYYADFVAHPAVYRVMQDPSKLPPFTLPSDYSIDARIAELGRYVLEPLPTERTSEGKLRVTADNAAYANELGAALDAALMRVVNENPERVVKINAMRVYAAACRSGAPAHWPTVTKLVSDPKTRPEIKVYALQAAANLLSAYDPDDYPSRRHSIGSKKPRDAADKEIGALVKALEDCVTNPKLLLPDYPDGKDVPEVKDAKDVKDSKDAKGPKDGKEQKKDAKDAKEAPKVEPKVQPKVEPKEAPEVKPTDNQVEVVRYLRREAIRALAQVRFAMLPGPEGKDKDGKVKMIYPAYTLARVCMADPTLGPAPTPSECAEAVLGLTNMAPVWERAPVKEFSADAATLAVAHGLVNFASRKANTPGDQTVKWLHYSARLSDSLRAWPPLFNFLFDPLKPNPADADAAPAIVKDLVSRAQDTVLGPMVSKGGSVSVANLQTFIKQQEEKASAAVLFSGVPATTLPGFQKK